MKRIGLFGGTFNPIHRGHLRAADLVRKKFSLDPVCFIPSSMPPHKEPDFLAAAQDRLAMIRLAIADNPFFIASDVEITRGGPSFTIDTVRYYQSNSSKETRFFLIMGIDAFLEIHLWRSYLDLVGLIPLIVMTRPVNKPVNGLQGRGLVEDYLHAQISDRYRFSTQGLCFEHPYAPPIYLIDVGLMDLSSSQIRNCLKNGQTVDHLVPSDVEAYIKTKGLYL